MPYAKITHHDKNVSTQNDNSHLGFVFQAKLHKDLFFEDIDAHYKSLKAYDLPEFAMSDEDREIAPNKPQIRRLEGNNFS